MIVIHTDGACEPNPGRGGWGFTCSDGLEQCGGEDNTTNNRMELLALLKALESLSTDKRAVIFSDSRYCVDGMNSWRHSWKRRNWQRKKDPLKNLDLWKALDVEANKRPGVLYQWVRGHSGDPCNERADELAQIGRMESIADRHAQNSAIATQSFEESFVMSETQMSLVLQ